MAYVPLVLPADIGAETKRIIEERVEPFLREVHMLLALPRDNEATGYLAAVSVLMALVSGISMELYPNFRAGQSPKARRGKTGERSKSGYQFVGLLTNCFPWCEEPNTSKAIKYATAACHLYDGFRNPVAHNLGYAKPRSDNSGALLKNYGRLVLVKGDANDDELACIEQAADRPSAILTHPTLYEDEGALKLNLKSFYWGVRRMTISVLRDFHNLGYKPTAKPAATGLAIDASAPSTPLGAVKIP